MNTDKTLEKILNKIESMDNKVESMNNKIESMDSQLTENTQILRALEYNSQVHKAELDKLNIKVAELAGNEEKIKKLEDGLKNHYHNITIKSDKTNVS